VNCKSEEEEGRSNKVVVRSGGGALSGGRATHMDGGPSEEGD